MTTLNHIMLIIGWITVFCVGLIVLILIIGAILDRLKIYPSNSATIRATYRGRAGDYGLVVGQEYKLRTWFDLYDNTYALWVRIETDKGDPYCVYRSLGSFLDNWVPCTETQP